ncbi:hypothetical protein [Aquihabitans sp. McL0605]|uniref:hypothetical protein n=1 Tax=Aquihabitans sp. McL0605 TaxID=3415671 RepID=UPI003CF9AF02
MAETERPWAIDAGLAGDLGDALGWAADDGAGALAEVLPTLVPVGSTAKLASIASGEVPPGADPDLLARRVLDHLEAKATRPAGGAPSPTWSCWVLATVMAALVDAAGIGPVRVAATRRVDEQAPVVDLHAAVLVGGSGGAELICDPYFGLSVELPSGAEAVAAASTALSESSVARSHDGGWMLDVRLRRWDQTLRYRLVGAALDRGDVHAMAAISVTCSGVPSRPYARIHPDGSSIVDASETADGTGLLRTWSPSERGSEAAFASWSDAADGFAERTGIRVV